MKIFFSSIIISLIFFSCSNEGKKDSSILSEKEMTAIMWDLTQADQFVQDFVMKDSTKNRKEESVKLYEEVFALHHTTAEQFKKSQEYYQSDPLRYRPIMDSLARKQSLINQPVRPIPLDTNQKKLIKQFPKE